MDCKTLNYAIAKIPMIILMIVLWIFGFAIYDDTYFSLRLYDKKQRTKMLYNVGVAVIQGSLLFAIIWSIHMLFFPCH